MEYGLTREVLARTPFLSLGEADFQFLKDSKSLLVDALGLEESFNLVVGNFYEYESTLLNSALHALIYAEGSWSDFTGTIHEINRRVVNLLSGCRAYLDQGAHFLSGRFGKKSEEAGEFANWRSQEYDNRLGYRVMEGLRNYTQHRGIAVHHLTHNHWRTDEDGASVARNSIRPGISPKRLREDRGLKRKLLEELESIGDPVDLRPLIREYVAGLATIHEKLRKRLEKDVEAADAAILNAMERYRTEGEQEVIGLAAVKRNESSVTVDQVALFDDLIVRRRELVSHTRRIPHLRGHYTTNEPRR